MSAATVELHGPSLGRENSGTIFIATPNRAISTLLQYLLYPCKLIVAKRYSSIFDLTSIGTSVSGAVLIVDNDCLKTKDELNALSELAEAESGIRILVVGEDISIAATRRVILSGAHGYLSISTDTQFFTKAIREVAAGGLWFPRRLLTDMIGSHFRARRADRRRSYRTVSTELTPRQQAIASLVARGFTNRQIAAKLYITEKTVKAHVSGIYRRLQVSNRVQLGLLVRPR